mgnify:CR=1 FL=1
MEFTPVSATIGGVLIGLSASVLLLRNDRVAGISGIVGGALARPRELSWRVMFIGGLLLGGLVASFVAPQAFGAPLRLPIWQLALGGLLVGVGTRLGNGCTSGHGVCGISRGSPRSLANTALFIGFGMLSLYLVRRFAG